MDCSQPLPHFASFSKETGLAEIPRSPWVHFTDDNLTKATTDLVKKVSWRRRKPNADNGELQVKAMLGYVTDNFLRRRVSLL